MSTTAPSRPPSLLILGTDTLLAAAPATAVQLSHACVAAGFDAVVPASWGDELVAARVLERVSRIDGPAVQCSCPRVLERLGAHGDAIEPMLVCTVSPAAAVADYLRALYAPARPAITFAGGCGGGASDAIDQWLSPDDLLAVLASRGIAATAQPTEFESLPPDRRRFHSEPGGLPTSAALRQVDPALRCVEVHTSDFIMALGQHLLSCDRVLLDVAPVLGCACAGAAAGIAPAAARARAREHEPPRAPSPIVDHTVPVVLDAEPPRARSVASAPPRAAAHGGVIAATTDGARTVGTDVAPALAALATAAPPEPSATPPSALPSGDTRDPARRRSPVGLPRPVFGAAPRASRADGRHLPRAYVARRRSSPRGIKTIPAGTRDSGARPTLRERALWVAGGLIAGIALVTLVRVLG